MFLAVRRYWDGGDVDIYAAGPFENAHVMEQARRRIVVAVERAGIDVTVDPLDVNAYGTVEEVCNALGIEA